VRYAPWREKKKFGTYHSEKIDFISERDGKLFLFLVQADDVDESNIFQFQEKLNNYLAFILDGQLDSDFPKYRMQPARIEINFQFEPKGIAREFLDKVTKKCLEENVVLTYTVGATHAVGRGKVAPLIWVLGNTEL
jgi:hypothetical protein